MVKITNIFGDRYSGQAGKAGVFATWKGRQYRRSYVIPANPNTTKQQTVRTNLANAIVRWHEYCTEQRRAYAYMAAGLVMSGFNLLCSRWQKAMPTSDASMIEPSLGIKQCGYTKTAKQDLDPAPTAHAFSLSFQPNVIGSLTATPSGTDVDIDAYVETDQGFIRIPTAITKADGLKDTGEALVAGDTLCISYESGGRVVTREVIFTIPADPVEIPAAATMALAYRTQYAPIDFGSVVLETHDVDGGASEWTQLETIEIDSILGKIYFDMTDYADASSAIDYDTYTALEDTKLEMTKADTSFVAWRDYADANGYLPIAATYEDETFDLVFTKTGHTSVLATAKTASLAALTEFVDMGAP